jgi:RNA-directed DNA polymerase
MNETRGRNCMCKLMEEILGKNNLNQEYLQVYRNKGSHGIDKMTVDELKSYLKINTG